jgi:peptidoglycan/xylan/chitin deacetylase (PgdA/CDA1 family)
MKAVAGRLLRRVAASTGLVDGAIRLSGDRVRILTYHGVSPHTLDPRLFRAQLAFIAARFDCFWVSELPALLDGKLRLTRPPLVITFDDGLLGFATHAAPALADAGLKATLFVVSDLFDEPHMMWNHELRCRLTLAKNAALPPELGIDSPDGAARAAQIVRLVETAKGWSEERRRALLDTLRAACPSPAWEPWMLDRYRLMGRDDVRALPAVVEIGSHSRTHPILSRISDERARDEIFGSRAALEALLGRPVVSFCYPDGDHCERDVALARQAYAVAVGRDEALATSRSNRHDLPRIPAATDMDSFAWRMVRPAGGS